MSESAHAPLGVFDSGVGGLTVLSALRRVLPAEDFIYVGDTARVPYGGKPLEMVRGFAREISRELLARGVKGIVIACNTASAASLPALAYELPVPVWGVVEPGVQAAWRVAGAERIGGPDTPRTIGVLCTQGTLKSRAYQSRLEALGLTVWAQACPLFVPIVEEGASDSAIARLVAEHYLAERPPLDAVILGCTHYPALKPILREVLGEGVALLDSAEETAAVVARDLAAGGLAREEGRPGKIHHLVSGDLPSYLHTARILDGPEGTVECIGWQPQDVVAG